METLAGYRPSDAELYDKRMRERMHTGLSGVETERVVALRYRIGVSTVTMPPEGMLSYKRYTESEIISAYESAKSRKGGHSLACERTVRYWVRDIEWMKTAVSQRIAVLARIPAGQARELLARYLRRQESHWLSALQELYLAFLTILCRMMRRGGIMLCANSQGGRPSVRRRTARGPPAGAAGKKANRRIRERARATGVGRRRCGAWMTGKGNRRGKRGSGASGRWWRTAARRRPSSGGA